MISSLNGTSNFVGPNFLEVLVGGVGYKVWVTTDTAASSVVGNQITLYIHTHVREDAFDLFGCTSRHQLELFEKLISVSGIGPKTALNVLSLAGVDDIEGAIVRGDAAVLTKVSGIGKKTAERIVLELAGKISALPTADRPRVQSEDGDVIDALMGLGYSQGEAREALKALDISVQGVDAKVKAALKSLSK